MRKYSVVVSVLLVVLVLVCTIPVTAQTPKQPKYVIFRDDDVGLGNQTDTLKAVNQVQIDEGIPVTLGIVPHPYSPSSSQPEYDDVPLFAIPSQEVSNAGNKPHQDPAFLDYMRTISANPLFEFAQHGYAHHNNGLATSSRDTSEFAGEPYSVQYVMIRDGRSDIKAAFGKTPTTFIPPWDRGDITTLEALRELGFTEYCSGGTDMQALHGRVSGIQVEPAFDIYGSSHAALNESVKKAKDRIDQFFSDPHADTIVVAYHFWQFSGPQHSVDLKKVQLLRDFITYVKHNGRATFTTLDRSITVQSEEPAATVRDVSSSPFVGAAAHGGPLLDMPGDALNSFANSAPLYTLAILIIGVLLVGRSLHVRRGPYDAPDPDTSLRPFMARAPAEKNTRTTPAHSSGWDRDAFRTQGVVVPTDHLTQLLPSVDHQPANAHVESSASDPTDE